MKKYGLPIATFRGTLPMATSLFAAMIPPHDGYWRYADALMWIFFSFGLFSCVLTFLEDRK